MDNKSLTYKEFYTEQLNLSKKDYDFLMSEYEK